MLNLNLYLCVGQIEAALSRMPGAGGRVSLQTRLDEVRHRILIMFVSLSPVVCFEIRAELSED